jgi:predicted dehydrogenase
MKLCLVGCGRWGKSYLKTIKKIPSISINWIVLRKSLPEIEGNYNFVYDLDKLLKEEKIDGVVIVTPPETHFELAKICIKHRTPILIEKPFTQSYKESRLLSEELNKHKLICMVGYQHLFSKKHQLLKKQTLNIGKIKNVNSIAISDGPFRENISVIRDWGSHEVAVAIDLFEDLPKTFKIRKIYKNFTNYHKGLYSLQMNFSDKRQFNSIFGNQSKIKKKQLIVEYDDGLVFQDNLNQSGNVIISNNKLVDIEEIKKTYSLPLESSLKTFQKKVKNNSYFTNIELSLNVNKVLDQLESKI